MGASDVPRRTETKKKIQRGKEDGTHPMRFLSRSAVTVVDCVPPSWFIRREARGRETSFFLLGNRSFVLQTGLKNILRPKIVDSCAPTPSTRTSSRDALAMLVVCPHSQFFFHCFAMFPRRKARKHHQKDKNDFFPSLSLFRSHSVDSPFVIYMPVKIGDRLKPSSSRLFPSLLFTNPSPSFSVSFVRLLRTIFERSKRSLKHFKDSKGFLTSFQDRKHDGNFK